MDLDQLFSELFKGKETKHWSHEHDKLQLEFHIEAVSFDWTGYCYGCSNQLGGMVYRCGESDCYFRLCQSCFESSYPHQVTHHPLHPAQPLVLQTRYSSLSMRKGYICEGCDCFSVGFVYRCEEEGCDFNLDVQCALLMNENNQIILESSQPTVAVSALPVSDTAYGCFDCHAIFHERCIEIPKERQHLYHPQHSLVAGDALKFYNCKACNYAIFFGMEYTCSQCSAFAIHVSCAEYITSTLNSSCHDHILFSFAKEGYPELKLDGRPERLFECNVCGKECSNSFFRCVECDMNFHHDCIPLPKKVIKHQWHSHPLTLVYSVREDDSGEYYCEICCEPRNPNHGAYYCEECKDQHGALVIAHIGCTLDEEDDSLEILSSICSSPSSAVST
ncbi:hypothetical protein Tsubulata_036266 [Turnera subulata]|uniref:DC1 domain-containing protein n=1 Tax=Turnera subulata TaxID=218843 RepID=A0A9Q0FCE1_9ROSI|nr:hypothetical protein Tsubulata_036266 [Turnera subulata]